MTPFDRAFEIIVGVEGRQSLNPHDRGNWTGGVIGVGILKGTKFGISAMRYPNLDIAALTMEQAKTLYLNDYWNAARCHRLPEPLSILVFDSVVNQGQSPAVKMLQMALKVDVDGKLGPGTAEAAAKANLAEVCALYLAERALRYTTTGDFGLNGRGWFARLFRVYGAVIEPQQKAQAATA
jgi:lysozyme family protein